VQRYLKIGKFYFYFLILIAQDKELKTKEEEIKSLI